MFLIRLGKDGEGSHVFVRSVKTGRKISMGQSVVKGDGLNDETAVDAAIAQFPELKGTKAIPVDIVSEDMTIVSRFA